MARPSNTDERRAQIARALLTVMARKGYDGASIAEVAEAAQLTPGLVHYHFESKREILLLALKELGRGHLSRLEERLRGSGGDPARQLEAFLDFHLGLGADANPEALACWVLVGGEALREPMVQSLFEGTVAQLCRRLEVILRGGVEQGAFACAHLDAVAAGIIALIQGYLALAASARSTIPRGSAARTARLMVKGLLSPGVPGERRASRRGKEGRR